MFRPGNLGHLGRLGLVAASRNAFNPLSLFAAGEQGVWYDPSDLSTLFQDSAGTTPVTAAGQPVGRMLDKSGRGNHATQSTDANRPTLQIDAGGRYYLACDGSNDGMATSAIDFTGTGKVSIFAGLRKLSDAAQACFVELSYGNTNNGMFNILAPRSGASFCVTSRGTAVNSIDYSTYTAPITSVISAQLSSAAANYLTAVVSRINGVQVSGAANSSASSTGNYGNHSLFLFRRNGATNQFNGHFYGLIIRGASSTADQIANTERWMAAKTGVTF